MFLEDKRKARGDLLLQFQLQHPIEKIQFRNMSNAKIVLGRFVSNRKSYD